MCRALYTNTHGRQVSKKRAGLWAQAYLPQWAPLIQQSLDWLSERDDETDDDEGFRETVCFVHEIADRIAGPDGGGPGSP
jgi:hypothetical protein